MSVPLKSAPMYCTQWCDGYTYCSADQLRPRDRVALDTHVHLGDLLCAHFPTTPLFYAFRDVRNYGALYGNASFSFQRIHAETLGMLPLLSPHAHPDIETARTRFWAALDPRIAARLALCANVMEAAPTPVARQRLREYALQHAPAMIAALRGLTAMVPHDNVRYTVDILPLLPIRLTHEFVCRLDPKLHNIPLGPVLMSIMWGLLEKTTPRVCILRSYVKQIAGNFHQRPVFHLTLDVMLLYGFLGCYAGAAKPPSMLVSMAILCLFRRMQHSTQAEYRAFIKSFVFVSFLSWILFTFDHVDRNEALRSVLDLFPTRQRYMAEIRASMDAVHALLETNLAPVALSAILSPTTGAAWPLTGDPGVTAAWLVVTDTLKDMHTRYKAQVGTNVIMRTMEPAFECLSTKWMTKMRSAIRDGVLAPETLPTCMRNELGNHALLSQDELRAIHCLAAFNVAVAAQPIPPLLLLLGISEEALRILTRCVIKFTCRQGAKHAILVDAAECIATCDLRSTMIIQQFLEHCSVLAGIYLAPLSCQVAANQAAALRRRFPMAPENATAHLGRFCYCSGCRVKLTQSVRHPNINSLLCTSMHAVQTIAYYRNYLEYRVPAPRSAGSPEGRPSGQPSALPAEPPARGAPDTAPQGAKPREETKLITQRTRRAGCTSGAFVLAETGTVACSGYRADDPAHPSWCKQPPTCVSLVGHILYVNHKAYTVCTQCGSICSYVPSHWTSNGPVCSVHPPELAAVLHKHATTSFNVLSDKLNAFLNDDGMSTCSDGGPPTAPWMCEIARCRSRCVPTCNVVLMDERDCSLRFARLCTVHLETLHYVFGRANRSPDTMRYHFARQINEWIVTYCSAELRRMRFLNYDSADQFFGGKK